MSDRQESDTEGETVTDGAVKGGDGNYFFKLNEQEEVDAGGSYSTSSGGLVEGDRHQAGLMTMDGGTGADPHQHPNEQFIYVLEGRARLRIADEEAEVAAGDMAFVPAETVHTMETLNGEDVLFFTTKDLSHGIVGNPIDE